MISVNGGILTQEVTGVQRYASEILVAITQIAIREGWNREKIRIVGMGQPQDSAFLEAASRITTPKLPRPLWAQVILPVFSRGPLLSLGNIGPLGYANQILCVHDANVYIVPESYTFGFRAYYRCLLPVLARRVKHLVTVSDFSRTMLRKHGVSGRRDVHVIPNGHEHALRWDADKSRLVQQDVLRRPFVFMIGSRARHKNTQIVEAIAPELDQLGLDLVIAGRSGGHFQNIQQMARPNVIMLGPVTDDDLAYLYARALCLAFPSTTEGFGLPALEAMTLGCPVVAANVASMPEVCGEAALYADPHDSATWLNQIRRLTQDPGLRQDLAAAGLAQGRKFSWAEGARRYLDLAACR
jgi:glycosyltransferase involved in cell wall biosynthesis